VKNKVRIEIQYFEDCQNSKVMIQRVESAIKNLNVEYKKTLVEDYYYALKIGFRGSPTLLINDIDFEDLCSPKEPGLSCRYYKNGMPTIKEIKNKILLTIIRSNNESNNKDHIFCIGGLFNFSLF